MDIVKKNLLSIISGVIAIVAVVLIFFPLGGMFETLHKDTEASKKTGDDINALINQKRTWPTLSPKEEDKVALEGFPTDATIKNAENITKSWTLSSTSFLEQAIRLQRERFVPLARGVLPRLSSVSAAIGFTELYQRKFGLFKAPNGDIPQDESIYVKTLNSTMPPTPEEVRTEQQRREAQIRAQRTVLIGGQPSNGEEVTKLVQEATAKVSEKMRSDRAFNFSIYADPATSLEANIKVVGGVMIEDIFDAQLTLWLQEDLCHAIADINHVGQTPVVNIIGAPIKRLQRLSIRHPYRVNAPAALPVGGAPAGGTPPELVASPTAKLTPNYTNDPFGHVSNDFYDVAQYELTITCDATQINNVLAGLSRNRYVIVSSVKMDQVDSAVDAVQGYYYGEKPVVQLTIQGQYLVLRPVIKQFVPSEVILALQAQTAAQPAQ